MQHDIEQEYKNHPQLEAIARFWELYPKTLDKLYQRFIAETNANIKLAVFVAYIYFNAPELVFPDPSLN